MFQKVNEPSIPLCHTHNMFPKLRCHFESGVFSDPHSYIEARPLNAELHISN